MTPKYRDFTPGEFVWRRSGLLDGRGFRRVTTPTTMVGAYYDKVGFQPADGGYVLEIRAQET